MEEKTTFIPRGSVTSYAALSRVNEPMRLCTGYSMIKQSQINEWSERMHHRRTTMLPGHALRGDTRQFHHRAGQEGDPCTIYSTPPHSMKRLNSSFSPVSFRLSRHLLKKKEGKKKKREKNVFVGTSVLSLNRGLSDKKTGASV